MMKNCRMNTAAIDPVAFLETYGLYSPSVGATIEAQMEGPWTVWANFRGKYVMLHAGLDSAWSEWQAEQMALWPDEIVCDPARLTSSHISWDEAVAFILAHRDGPLPPAAPRELNSIDLALLEVEAEQKALGWDGVTTPPGKKENWLDDLVLDKLAARRL